MLIAQISDTHVHGPRADGWQAGQTDTPARLRLCVATLNALTPRPDIVLMTGDLVHGGAAEDYKLLAGLLEPLEIPFYLVPGNHDRRANLLAAFGGRNCPAPAGGFIQYVLEDYPVRLIALDTLEEGREGGRLCETRLNWLRNILTELSERPTVVFMHHPPIRSGLAGFDKSPFLGAEGLAQVLRESGRVERILCGHLHRSAQAQLAGTMITTAPSTAFQVALDLTADAPLRVVRGPAAFQLHLWAADSGLVSHTGYME
ncbi:MAG: phosphodiesterase [Alphaproteobacteria bacterium]|nr:phosphodiesterase [Alphaproteobacteria bacterium]